MKKLKVLLAALLVLALATPSFAYDYWANVYKMTNTSMQRSAPVTTGITVVVLTAGSDSLATLTKYNDRANTVVANPITATNYALAGVGNGRVQFRSTSATVDLIVTDTAGGYTAFVAGFSPNDHQIIIDERPNVMHHGVVRYSADTTSEVSTGVTFAAQTFIHDVRSEVVTTSTGGTLNVGLSGYDADGFLAARSIAAAGHTADTGVITNGSTIDYTPATTYGVLLYTSIAGSDAVATVGGRSFKGHIVLTAASGVMTYTASTTANSGSGYIHYWFTRMR